MGDIWWPAVQLHASLQLSILGLESAEWEYDDDDDSDDERRLIKE